MQTEWTNQRVIYSLGLKLNVQRVQAGAVGAMYMQGNIEVIHRLKLLIIEFQGSSYGG